MRNRLTVFFVAIVIALTACTAAHADIAYDLNLPGIGNQIPVVSYSFGNPNTLSVTRVIDGFSPSLFLATANGTLFSTGSFDTFDTSFSATIPITSFEMTNILVTSIQFGIGDLENVTLHYETGSLVNNAVPEPSSMALLTSGLFGLGGVIRRKLARSN